jgi:predicted DNA-binding transcriptional regulator AlpA
MLRPLSDDSTYDSSGTRPPITSSDLYRMVFEMKDEVRATTNAAYASLSRVIGMKSKDNEKKPMEVYTSREVMALLKVSERTLYTYRKKGLLPHTKIGGRYLYLKEEVERLLRGDAGPHK